MNEHRIVAVTRVTDGGACAQCSPTAPHNIVARCACGQAASGRTNHTWTLSEDGPNVSLQPSFNWLNDPNDASKGSHLHEFVSGVPLLKLHDLFDDNRVLPHATAGA